MATNSLAIMKGLSGVPLRVFSFARRWPVVPGVIIAGVLIAAIFAPLLEPQNPLHSTLRHRNQPPFWYAEGGTNHLLGADPVGRDILSRLIRAARVTVIVVASAAATGTIIGTTLGLVAGYMGGIVDEVIMRIVDLWAALPGLLIILTLVVVVGNPSFTLLVFALALLSWTGPVRLVRAETLTLRTRDYVLMAHVVGASTPRILFRHILPGVVHIVIVSTTLGVGFLILTEATLSFLGAGVPPPNPSWGSMAADGREYLRDAWWVAIFPGVAILLVVMSGNFLGDWMRDRFDPRLRQID